MRLPAVLRRRRRTAFLGALVLTGLVAGSLSGVALSTRGQESMTTARSLGGSDTDGNEVRMGTKGPPGVDVAADGIAVGSHAGWRAHVRPRLAKVEPSTARPAPSLRSAGRFFLTALEQKVSGEWATAWQSLYPLHKRIAPRDTFVRCETATPFSAPLESIRVVRVRAASVHVPGLPRPVPGGAAVTVAVELRWYGPRDPITFTHTFHLAPVEGHWTWILSRDRYRHYLRDTCFGVPEL